MHDPSLDLAPARRIAIVGCGHVGLVMAAGFSRLGHDVTGLDRDAELVSELGRGVLRIQEESLPQLVAEGVAAGRLRFTTDHDEAIAEAELPRWCSCSSTRAPTSSRGPARRVLPEARRHRRRSARVRRLLQVRGPVRHRHLRAREHSPRELRARALPVLLELFERGFLVATGVATRGSASPGR